MNYIDRKYVLIASTYLQGWKDLGRDIYNFRCPYCGDSKSNSHKRRGYLFTNKDKVTFKCHNCGMVCGLKDFLNIISPSLATEYRFEKFIQPKKMSKKTEETNFKMEQPFQTKAEYPWTNILDLPPNHEARLYLDSRMIPKQAQSRLGYVDDFNKVYQAFEEYKTKVHKSNSGAVIIPFYNEQGILTYIQGRLFNDKFRYITIQTHKPAIKIYGLERVDTSKKVWIFEGPFDSMFLDNSIACAGASSMVVDSERFENSILVFDRDYMTNYEVYSQLRKAVNSGRSVVLYDERFEWNDANAAIQAGLSIDQLESYLSERTFNGLKAQLELTKIKAPKKQ